LTPSESKFLEQVKGTKNDLVIRQLKGYISNQVYKYSKMV